MGERLFGIESEYALTALGSGGRVLDREDIALRLVRHAKRLVPHLPGYGPHGIFLPSGRFYIDAGLHPEFCTPECANPWDVVRYTLAGERLLTGFAAALAVEPSISEIMLFRCNVDYSGARTTWGQHESYLHRGSTKVLCEQILPHLVSRIIFTGSGGFVPFSAGLLYTISPRVAHLEAEVSGSSTHHRGIFHTKDEPLSAKGYHRLHILCGENLCSQVASWLKVGTTALVVAMIEAGLGPAEGLHLRSPLEAMRAFAADPSCRVEVASAEGKALTAISIQRRYLEVAEAHLWRSFMPPWAPDVCREWRRVLTLLEGAPESVATTLDWAMKLALYRDRFGRHSRIRWEDLPQVSGLLEMLRAANRDEEGEELPFQPSLLLDPESPIRRRGLRFEPSLSKLGLDWDDLFRFIQLRPVFLEIDTRFGQLGPEGIFNAMDGPETLTHHLAGVDNIEHAVANPPAVGRARVRGECIRRLSGNNARYICNWQMIIDRQKKQMLDLSDPFVSQEEWRDSAGMCPPELLESEMHSFMESFRVRLGARRRRTRSTPTGEEDPTGEEPECSISQES